MAVVEIVRETSVPVQRLWAVVTDWQRHAEQVPLTQMVVVGAAGEGQRVDAVTSIGPFAMHDTMRVTRWLPPIEHTAGVARLEKTGRVLRGFAEIEVESTATGSRVIWREQILPRPAWLGLRLVPVTDRAVRIVFGRALDALVTAAERSA